MASSPEIAVAVLYVAVVLVATCGTSKSDTVRLSFESKKGRAGTELLNA